MIHDPELTEYTRTIHSVAASLDEMAREGNNHGLLIAFAKIQHAAQKAGWRMIEIEKK